MAHMIEKLDRGGFRKNPAWHALLETFQRFDSALEAAKAYWTYTVEMVPITLNGVESDFYGLQRVNADGSHGQIYGVATDQYQPLQPWELAEEVDLFSALAKEDGYDCEVESIFTMQNGKRALIQLRIPQLDTVLGQDDAYKGYVTWHTTFDAKSATDVHMSRDRIVCNNTYRMSRANAGSDGIVNVRHSRIQKAQLAILRNVLRDVLKDFDAQSKVLNNLYSAELAKITKEEVFARACDLMLPIKAKKKAQTVIDTRAAAEQSEMVTEMVARAKEQDQSAGSALIEILAANPEIAVSKTISEEKQSILQVRRQGFLDACLRAWEIEQAQTSAGSAYHALQAVSDVLQHRDSYTASGYRGTPRQRAEAEYGDVFGLSPQGKVQPVQESILSLILANSI